MVSVAYDYPGRKNFYRHLLLEARDIEGAIDIIKDQMVLRSRE